jgi:hypothetical protein
VAPDFFWVFIGSLFQRPIVALWIDAGHLIRITVAGGAILV